MSRSLPEGLGNALDFGVGVTFEESDVIGNLVNGLLEDAGVVQFRPACLTNGKRDDNRLFVSGAFTLRSQPSDNQQRDKPTE